LRLLMTDIENAARAVSTDGVDDRQKLSLIATKTAQQCHLVLMSLAIDGFAPSTESAAPSTNQSMAQQSVDRATTISETLHSCGQSWT